MLSILLFPRLILEVYVKKFSLKYLQHNIYCKFLLYSVKTEVFQLLQKSEIGWTIVNIDMI